MPRELLLEIGLEELPASWLPGLTRQLGERLAARLSEQRLTASAPETFSTPRRLGACVARLADRQDDLEETITGPPVSAAIGKDGHPSPAGLGFARKQGVAFADLGRAETPKGEYLAYRKRERGRPAADVLPDVLAAVLRDLAFPKQMRWDARLDDGKGELVFGRPIRWLLFLYNGRVVPFAIRRSPEAAGPQVQDVVSGALTYGHRFLTTSGRAGRSIRVKSFADYRKKLAEHFVVLDHDERHKRIARDLESHARRLGGRVFVPAGTAFLDEVSDLVEYPAVVAGSFDPAFLQLPTEVLTTTMIHHQHDFPVVDDSGQLNPVFLAVTNAQPADERPIAANAERVLAARLRDAAFFWDTDRRTPLDARLDRLDTVLFHKSLGSYRKKAERMAALAEWIARAAFGRPDQAEHARRAALLAKADLTTEMVGEFPELQGVMGGIYAREEGQPEEAWKAIYHHYLPIGVEADAPPSRADLGAAAVTWAAVSLADKLDTVVGLFLVGEEPTGSRDPFGLRRHAQAVVRVLYDLPELTGMEVAPELRTLVDKTLELHDRPRPEWTGSPAKDSLQDRLLKLDYFLAERVRSVLERRGFAYDEVNAVVPVGGHGVNLIARPYERRRAGEDLRVVRQSQDFLALAEVFKRVRNITKELTWSALEDLRHDGPPLGHTLREPAELALLGELDQLRPTIERCVERLEFKRAFLEIAKLRGPIDRFFTEVYVMVDDETLRHARLWLMAELRDLVAHHIADISEIVPHTDS